MRSRYVFAERGGLGVPPQLQCEPDATLSWASQVEEEKDTLLPLEEQAPVGRVKRPKHNTVGAGKVWGLLRLNIR